MTDWNREESLRRMRSDVSEEDRMIARILGFDPFARPYGHDPEGWFSIPYWVLKQETPAALRKILDETRGDGK